MRLDGNRRSSNFEDRGTGRGGGGGVPIRLLFSLVRLLGFKGTLIVGTLLGVGYLFLPDQLQQGVRSSIVGEPSPPSGSRGSVCNTSEEYDKACTFSRVVLASTEDVWTAHFQRGDLPAYGSNPGPYRAPTLVVFLRSVDTGCGNATSDVGPFYCGADQRLYIDPSFYREMAKTLRAPGDFAQAYVIAHEVGHHIQRLIGSSKKAIPGETKNQTSVRVELQADCLAGVWGHAARASLEITDEDLREALGAAHAIGDDALGHSDKRNFTHGSSDQRKRWFGIGFKSGDARQCDTFAIARHADL